MTITFDSDLEGDLAIFAMDVDGSNLRRLGASGSGSFANWAPDGSKVLFSGAAEGGGVPALYTMDPDGTNWHAVTGRDAEALAPSWNPADFTGPPQRADSP